MMAPTIQNGNGTAANPADKRLPQRPTERKSELINKVKYCNTLPDIPFDLKFLAFPFESDRFVHYKPTSLEQTHRYDVLTEHDLGVSIDLIDRDLYAHDPYAQMDPADEKLLEEDVLAPQDSMRSKYHAKSVSWLRKSEYISTEQTRFQPQTMEKVEAKVGFNVKKAFVEETLYMDRETQIVAIQKTFDEAKVPLRQHYSKPNVTAVETLPLFPDFDNWKFPCAQVLFDSDPAEPGKSAAAQLEEMSQAMIRGVMDDTGEQFVAYFVPNAETIEKRRRDAANRVPFDEDDKYEYKMAREYNWNVKSKASKGYEENYFLVVRNDGVFYNELETRVRLNKRRKKDGQTATNTRLFVQHIPLNAVEHNIQRARERQLRPQAEEDALAALDELAETAAKRARPNNNDGDDDDDDRSGSESGSDNEDGAKSKRASRSATPHSQRSSGSRKRSRSRSGTRSRSGSRSSSGSRSRSRSGSRSGSGSPRSRRSRSGSARSVRSGSRSRSGSANSGRSGSQSGRSRSGSPASQRSRSRSRSGSGSPRSRRSGTGSPHSRRSGSVRSRSGSAHSGSGSGSAGSGSDSASE